MLAMGLSYMAFIIFRYIASIPDFLRISLMKGYLILWNNDPRELDTTVTGVPGERSHHSLLLALSSELASGKWDCTNTGLHPCRFPRCQRGKGLPAASSESICLPPLPRKVCSHTLLSAKLEAETVSEQADVTPKSDGSSNTSQGEFPLPGSRRRGNLGRALKGQLDTWIFVLGTMATQLSPWVCKFIWLMNKMDSQSS